jgi:NTP pyrophosphohydrolases containing a Zn-finger, probably nucleic-acid-binding
MQFRRGPWTVKETNLRYKSEWVELNEHKVVRSDGHDCEFAVVRLKPGVSVLAIDDDRTVYLTREYRYAIEQESLEVVSGAIDNGETPEEAAKRELKEELGIVAGEFVDLGMVNPMTSQLHAPARLFVARNLTFTEPQRDAGELIEMVKMELTEAVQLVMDSVVTHAPSCVLILKANELSQPGSSPTVKEGRVIN